jgi:phenylalanyl-tRNA synthetase beta chain
VRFSDDWLRDCVETPLPPREVGEKLTAVGIPLDSIESWRVESMEPSASGDRRASGAAAVEEPSDVVYHFDVTTNRPDCMNHRGLARELSVATGAPLKEAPPSRSGRGRPASSLASVKVEAPELCDRYTALVVEGVRVGTSPAWLTRRLGAIGLRPINSVVDATNYVLWEMGQPLHAFDLARLQGKRIRVRKASPGEKLRTLDGIERKLDEEMLVIADERRAVAVAGVMGGRDTEIGPQTLEVLVESAHFHPLSVRKTARKLGLHTDASHRFERGADPEITLDAAARCASLIAELTGGRVAQGFLEDRPVPPSRREIALDPARVDRLLGLGIPRTTMRSILQRLGCSVEEADGIWRVVAPSFRGDLSLEEDLIEEIARHHGYDRIPVTLPKVFVFPEGRSESLRRLDRIRHAARHAGFSEALNLSLVSERDNRLFGEVSGGVRVLNPLAEGEDRLRSSLVPSLLRNLAHNLNHGLPEAALFETGRVFLPSRAATKAPAEEERAAWVMASRTGRSHAGSAIGGPDFFEVKGAINLALRLAGLPAQEWKPSSFPFLAPLRAARIGSVTAGVGWAGEISAEIAAEWGLEVAAWAGEISLDAFFALPGGRSAWKHTPLVRTPAVTRDLSMLLEQTVAYADLEEAIRSLEGVPVSSVHLFDRYQGPPVPQGKVSIAITVVFKTPERTLVSEEVSDYMDRIVQRLRERLGAVLRGN